MNLGEKIYKLRTERNLSQGDLAEKLGVSRQSVSKWENSSAMPDLEKIIKLSDIFGVSIDSLVKNAENNSTDAEKTAFNAKETKTVEYVTVVEKHHLEGRKIAGIVLFCMAFFIIFGILCLAGSLGGIVYALPFILCGVICFIFEENVGLWCVWTLFFVVDVFMRWGTSINRSLVLMTFKWTPQMNYTRLVAAWVIVLITAVIMAVTVLRFKNKPVAADKKAKIRFAAGWGIWIAAKVARHFVLSSSFYHEWLVNNWTKASGWYLLVNAVVSNIMLIWFTVVITYTLRYIKSRKNCVPDR